MNMMYVLNLYFQVVVVLNQYFLPIVFMHYPSLICAANVVVMVCYMKKSAFTTIDFDYSSFFIHTNHRVLIHLTWNWEMCESFQSKNTSNLYGINGTTVGRNKVYILTQIQNRG